MNWLTPIWAVKSRFVHGKSPIFLGFQAHTGYYTDDGLVLSLCGTLHSVIMREDVVEEFQNFMIQLTPEDDPEDVMFNWLWRYQNLQLEKGGQSKRKIRRSRKAR